MKPKIYLYGTSGQYGNYLAALTEAGAKPVLSRDLFRACGCDGLLLPGGGDIGVTLEATRRPLPHPDRQSPRFSSALRR